jgi:hypothetical protein
MRVPSQWAALNMPKRAPREFPEHSITWTPIGIERAMRRPVLFSKILSPSSNRRRHCAGSGRSNDARVRM